MNIQQLLDLTINQKASDLHLSVDFPPILRIHGDLIPVAGEDPITAEQLDSLISPLLSEYQKNIFTQNFELDFSFDFQSKARFRANVYRQKGHIAIALRLIPFKIPSLDELG